MRAGPRGLIRALAMGALSVLAAIAPVSICGQTTTQTLREVLRDAAVPNNAWAPVLLDRPLASVAVDAGADLFVIAFTWRPGRNAAVPDTLQLAVFDRAQGGWSKQAIATAGDSARGWSIGAPITVQHTSHYIYVDTHINPSAGALLVLTHQLRPVTTAYGWARLILPNDVVVYQASQVHFAPTHAAELRTFDPVTRRDTLLYPRRPFDAVRARYIDSVRAIYRKLGADWFRTNNQSDDPELFDSSAEQVFVSDDLGTVVAFVVNLGSREPGPARTPWLPVAVVCRDVTDAEPRCTEKELESLKRGRPGVSTEAILRELIKP